MGMSTTEITKECGRKFWKLDLIVSAASRNYFDCLPNYRKVTRVDKSDTNKVFFTLNNNYHDFIEVEI